MPLLVRLTSPGFVSQPDKFAEAVAMSRIMFPYIAFIAVFALHQGTLNANNAWGAPAFAPAAANVCMIAFLAFAAFFPKVSPGIASMASWGFLASGATQLVIVMVDARRRGLLERLTWPRWTPEIRDFLWMLGPAIGISASYQIGALADQIVGSLLPTGGLSAISYADRLYQLPGGVIVIATGSVLLREMSALVALGDDRGAIAAQNRAASLTLALGAPFIVAFLLIPDLIVAVAFEHGAFKANATHEAAGVLAAYAIGMPALLVDRIVTASFLSRGDTATPLKVTLVGVAVNVALKIALFRPLGAPGLALATAAGLWIKVGGVFALARRRGWTAPDPRLLATAAATLFAAGALALALTLADGPLIALMAHLPRFAREARFAALIVIGAAAYFPALILALWLTARRAGGCSSAGRGVCFGLPDEPASLPHLTIPRCCSDESRSNSLDGRRRQHLLFSPTGGLRMSVQARDLAVEFAYRFGRVPTVSRAPGRVNLIGEHTDYNDGFVMPAALEFATLTAASQRPDRRLQVYSMIMDETREFDLDSPPQAPSGDWSDYVLGVALMLEMSGRNLSGADLIIWSDVPIGAGLSSSAALEVSVAHALLDRERPAVRSDRNRQDLPARRKRLRRHALRRDGSIYLMLRRRRACAPDRLPQPRVAQCRYRAKFKASHRQ